MPGLTVNLNIALDGFRETHDRIRGVPGNFDKAISALESLYPARAANPKIRLHVLPAPPRRSGPRAPHPDARVG